MSFLGGSPGICAGAERGRRGCPWQTGSTADISTHWHQDLEAAVASTWLLTHLGVGAPMENLSWSCESVGEGQGKTKGNFQ